MSLVQLVFFAREVGMPLDLLSLVRLLAVIAIAGFLAVSLLSIGPGGRSIPSNVTAVKTPGYGLPAMLPFQQETNGARSPNQDDQ